MPKKKADHKQRTRKLLTEMGALVSPAERWEWRSIPKGTDPRTGKRLWERIPERRDAFGIGDWWAIWPAHPDTYAVPHVWLVQETSRSAGSSRRKKILASEHTRPLLVRGIRIVLVLWDKPQHRWVAKMQEVELRGENLHWSLMGIPEAVGG